jgi:signal transduction histidine kinase
MAHELKSPLARIKLALEAGSLTPAARDAVEQHARRAVIAIDRTVAELLEIARAEAGLRDDPRAPTDLHALATEVLADRAPPSGITVDVIGAATSTISPQRSPVRSALSTRVRARDLAATIEASIADGRAQSSRDDTLTRGFLLFGASHRGRAGGTRLRPRAQSPSHGSAAGRRLAVGPRS